jgi:hypothetical protein
MTDYYPLKTLIEVLEELSEVVAREADAPETVSLILPKQVLEKLETSLGVKEKIKYSPSTPTDEVHMGDLWTNNGKVKLYSDAKNKVTEKVRRGL